MVLMAEIPSRCTSPDGRGNAASEGVELPNTSPIKQSCGKSSGKLYGATVSVAYCLAPLLRQTLLRESAPPPLQAQSRISRAFRLHAGANTRASLTAIPTLRLVLVPIICRLGVFGRYKRPNGHRVH